MQNQTNEVKAGEWIMHNGSRIPPLAMTSLAHNEYAEIEFRDSTRQEFHRDSINALTWSANAGEDGACDIIAYRVMQHPSNLIDHERDQETEVETLKRQLAAALDDKAYLNAKLKISTNGENISSFQNRVRGWVMHCFGSQIADCKPERNHRFLEEALELVQALGCTREEAHQLVDYTFDRPVGNPGQETGGVMVTLAALCAANEISFTLEAETELGRISSPEVMTKIRLKQAAKPAMSPLPEYPAREPYKVIAGTIDSYIGKIEKLERDNEALRHHNEFLAASLRCDHPDDRAVHAFATRVKEKLAASRAKGRGGWDDPEQCSLALLAELLIDEIASKGDPLDIGAYAMMLHQRGAEPKDILEQSLNRVDTEDHADWPLAIKSYIDSVPCIPESAFHENDPNLTIFNVGECLRQYANRIEHETRNLDVAVDYIRFLHKEGLGTTYSTFVDQFKYDKEGSRQVFEFCEEFIGAVNFLLLTMTGKHLHVGQAELAHMGGSLGLNNTVQVFQSGRHEPRAQRPENNTQQVKFSEPPELEAGEVMTLEVEFNSLAHDRRKTDSERKCYLQSPAVIPNHKPSDGTW